MRLLPQLSHRIQMGLRRLVVWREWQFHIARRLIGVGDVRLLLVQSVEYQLFGGDRGLYLLHKGFLHNMSI